MLDKVTLGHSPLTDGIYLYRHGKDHRVALERREAEAEVVSVLVQHMMHDAPKGSKKDVCINGEWYEVQVKPAKRERSK